MSCFSTSGSFVWLWRQTRFFLSRSVSRRSSNNSNSVLGCNQNSVTFETRQQFFATTSATGTIQQQQVNGPIISNFIIIKKQQQHQQRKHLVTHTIIFCNFLYHFSLSITLTWKKGRQTNTHPTNNTLPISEIIRLIHFLK